LKGRGFGNFSCLVIFARETSWEKSQNGANRIESQKNKGKGKEGYSRGQKKIENSKEKKKESEERRKKGNGKKLCGQF